MLPVRWNQVEDKPASGFGDMECRTGNWTQRKTLTDRGVCILTDTHKYLQRDRWQHTEPMPAAQLESYAVTYDCKALTCIQNETSCLLHNDE